MPSESWNWLQNTRELGYTPQNLLGFWDQEIIDCDRKKYFVKVILFVLNNQSYAQFKLDVNSAFGTVWDWGPPYQDPLGYLEVVWVVVIDPLEKAI